MAGHTEGGSSSFVESLQPDYQCTDESPTTIIHPSSIPLAMEVSELMNITNWRATLDQDGHISDKWEDTLGEPDDTCDASPLEDDEESETESRSGSSYIYRGHWITVETSLLLILTFATTHSITDVQLSDMLALISLHCMETHSALGSLYKFKNYFEKADSPVQKYYYCGSCFSSVEDGQTNVL